MVDGRHLKSDKKVDSHSGGQMLLGAIEKKKSLSAISAQIVDSPLFLEVLPSSMEEGSEYHDGS